jgi:hydroxyacylglutathione hydrolase
MAGINRAGPRVLAGPPPVAPLAPADVVRHVDAGAWVVDGRDRWSFAAAHLPGSVNVELDDSFATFVGSVVPFDVPVVLVLPEPAPAAAVEAITQLLRIGYDHVVGELSGGLAVWQAGERPTRAYPARDVGQLHLGGRAAAVLDVRQPNEWDDGVIPGSRRIFLGDLPQRLSELPRGRRTWTICASGQRASPSPRRRTSPGPRQRGRTEPSTTTTNSGRCTARRVSTPTPRSHRGGGLTLPSRRVSSVPTAVSCITSCEPG